MANADSMEPIRANGGISNVYLVGNLMSEITGTKLPTRRQALCYMMYHIRCSNMNTREAANASKKQIMTFWNEARIPTRTDATIVSLIVRMQNEWRSLQKNTSRGGKQIRKEKMFCSKLNELFDIARHDALTTIERDEDRDFLLEQRKKGQPGCLSNVSEEFTNEMAIRTKRAKEAKKRGVIPITKKQPQSNLNDAERLI